MRLLYRLLIIAATPLAILLIMNTADISESLTERADAIEVIGGVDAVNAAGDLIHTLQIERGASAGYIGSKGVLFASELSTRRSQTDAARTAFFEMLQKTERTLDPSAQSMLSRIDQVRSSVDVLGISVADAAGAYTQSIAGLSSFSELQLKAASSPKVVSSAQALFALSAAKEKAGQERAMGANGFSAGKFQPKIFENFVSLSGAQNALFVKAISFASEEDKNAIKSAAYGGASSRVEQMRVEARQLALAGEPTQITGPEWFSASTARIDGLREVELTLGRSLEREAMAVSSAAATSTVTQLIIGAVSVCLALGIAFLASTSVSKPMAHLNGAMTRIGGGRFDVKIPAIKRKDEIGEMARTLRQFRDELSAGVETNEVAMYKGQAFDNTPSAMIMVDIDGRIKYINDATMQLFRENMDTFQENFPGFNPDDLVGNSFDPFHKNPSHQRGIISDPSRLPYKTKISLGDLHFEMVVSSVTDREGNHVGCILSWEQISEKLRNSAVLDAIDRTQAVVEFRADGTIQTANQNFIDITGYQLNELVGRHHRMLVPSEDLDGQEYSEFWRKLNQGETSTGKFRMKAKSGNDIWIEATYNPLVGPDGSVYKVLEIFTDITASYTERRRMEADRETREQEVQHVIEYLASGLRSLSSGDLTATIQAEFATTFEGIRADFNAAMTKLRHAMSDVVDNANGIQNGAGEISQAADDLSRRTEGQAATLEETAASLEQLTASVRAAAEGAEKADAIVREARSNAENSGEIVRDAVSSMGEIESSSKQISQIIGVIDDIAFQTNLLALNAGVEAARAGDAGRGFAVVASEVRALAQRSSEAAKEIKDLISSSTDQVERGVGLVGRAGQALEEIVESVADISSRVGEIASSAKEQSTGIAEINVAVNQMDQVTQQNAAMVEETTAASHSLTDEANRLIELMAAFETGSASESSAGGKSGVRQQQSRIAQSFKPAKRAAAGGRADDVEEWEDF